MNDTPNEPRYDERSESETRHVADDWSRAELESFSEAPPPRERLFSRRVLIGRALFAVAIYFGVGIVRTVIRESVRSTVSSVGDQIPPGGTVIYRTPNGKITISKSPNGSITISGNKPEVPAPATPSATAIPPAPSVIPAQPPPEAPTAPTAPKAKR